MYIPIPLLILIALLNLVLALTALWRRSGGDLIKPPANLAARMGTHAASAADLSARTMPGTPTDPAFPLEIDPALEEEIRILLSRNQKINAVKLVRERLRLTLKQSKDLAERYER